MAGRKIFDLTENLVSKPLVERPCLEGESLEIGAACTALLCVGLRSHHQPFRMTFAAHGFGNPDDLDVQPPSPDHPDETAEHLALIAPQKVSDRVISSLPRRGDVVVFQTVGDELLRRL